MSAEMRRVRFACARQMGKFGAMDYPVIVLDCETPIPPTTAFLEVMEEKLRVHFGAHEADSFCIMSMIEVATNDGSVADVLREPDSPRSTTWQGETSSIGLLLLAVPVAIFMAYFWSH